MITSFILAMFLFVNLEVICPYAENWTAWTFYCFVLSLHKTSGLKRSPEQLICQNLSTCMCTDRYRHVCFIHKHTPTLPKIPTIAVGGVEIAELLWI